MKITIIVLGMLVSNTLFAAEIYKYKDPSGRVSYSDTPPFNIPNKVSTKTLKSEAVATSNNAPSTLQNVTSSVNRPVVDAVNQLDVMTLSKVSTNSINPVPISSQAPYVATSPNLLFHHHINNFYFNDSDKSKPNYLAMHDHALAMSYDATTHYLAKTLPSNVDGLNRILLHNAYYIPATFDFDKHTVKYTVSYLDSNNRSTVNPERIVWNPYPVNSRDIEMLKGYGCAQSSSYTAITTSSNLSDAKKLFRIDKDYGRVVVNWQSRFVVDDLAKKTINSLSLRNYDYLFIDDLPRNPGNCINKDFGGKGSYASWKEGQLAFLQAVTNAARTMKGRHGQQIRVLGNIWSPYADTQSAKWYAEKQLRLDHYYFEAAGYAAADILHGQAANGKDPETGLPAYVPLTGGFIPANLVSLGTRIEDMYTLHKSADSAIQTGYMAQHFRAAGIASAQGSWFGWYGETSLDKIGADGELIHSNIMQLLRVIPNWENIAKVPLSSRNYNRSTNIYSSPNSKFSSAVIQGRNPLNNEVYVVFMSKSGQADLMGKKIATASFVNEYFVKTGEDALPCLVESVGMITLKCADKLNQGIRLTLY